ncbi:MAG: HEAT repeat domain-containing protein [Cyanobacteria bacterium SBLK]|nr:HEAT repeat domain-containing protein [Cyanobacteria bacterium SBLK]
MSEYFGAENLASPNGKTLTIETAIANLEQKEDTGLRYYAAWWLGRFRVKEPKALAVLIEALEDEDRRTPDGGYALRRNAAKALGKLEAKEAIPALLHCFDCDDVYVRESAAQALGAIGDRSCIPHLLKFLEGGVEAAKTVPGKPHLVQPYEAIIEALGVLQATEAIAAILPFLEHPVEKVQYGAARALYQLTGKDRYGQHLIEALQGDRLQLRRSALMDLGAVGYLPAAEAIAETLAENSLKLIALKGVLEHHLQAFSSPSPQLSEDSIRVLKLMDSLL